VLPGYLGVTRTRIVRGRDFTHDDISSGRDVAIVDEHFARALGTRDALGTRFVAGSGRQQRTYEIVGIISHVRMNRVADAARTNVRDEALPQVIIPFHAYPVEMTLVIRTHGEHAAVGPAIERVIEGLGTTRAVYAMRPLSAYVAQSLDSSRFLTLVLMAFAVASLLLAATGLYGTLAYLMALRTPEFGVRLALGASPRQLVALVAREGAVLASAGSALGLGAAWLVARLLRSQLYGVTPIDPATVTVVAALVAAAALVALSHPAWRAAHVDPNSVLRSE
jgi:hypothetical protein